jgi:hypothetical protein
MDFVIERKVSIGNLRGSSCAISCGAEFINMLYGGSRLKVALDEKAELARAEGIQSAARNWIREHLKTGKLRLFGDGGPLKVWVCEPQFWQRGDRASGFMQTSILDREGDERGAYVLDATALGALLDVAPPSVPKNKDGKVTNYPHKMGRRPAPYWPKAEEAAMRWLQDNGYPQPGDGGQAQLEQHVTEVLAADNHHPGESTVREHVGQWIAQYKQSVNE